MGRVTVVLKVDDFCYRFFSIFFSKRDSSFYVYNHMKDETTPILSSETIHLLKKHGSVKVGKLNKIITEKGNQVHLSVHPSRLYLKKRSGSSTEEHLIEEMEPQHFNKDNFRLLAILTPAPITHLERYGCEPRKKDEEVVVFDWNELLCPQVSLYELRKNFDIENIELIIPNHTGHKLIIIDDLPPNILLSIKRTEGNPDVWRPNVGIFGRLIKRMPITREKLVAILDYNALNFDISSIPDEAIITDFRFKDDFDDPTLEVDYRVK